MECGFGENNKAQDYSWASVVAEKGFEPMTFGL